MPQLLHRWQVEGDREVWHLWLLVEVPLSAREWHYRDIMDHRAGVVGGWLQGKELVFFINYYFVYVNLLTQIMRLDT